MRVLGHLAVVRRTPLLWTMVALVISEKNLARLNLIFFDSWLADSRDSLDRAQALGDHRAPPLIREN